MRVIKPLKIDRELEELDRKGTVEMRVHWELKVLLNKEDGNFVFIDGKETKMSLRSLLNVQLARLRSNINNNTTTSSSTFSKNIGSTSTHQKILFTGINRYVFDCTTGFCRELHVERVEPKIDRKEWKWRTATWFVEQKFEVGRRVEGEPAAF